MPKGIPATGVRVYGNPLDRRARSSKDEFKLSIADHIWALIEKEPDLAGYDFGFAKQGSYAYITVMNPDTNELATFQLTFRGTTDGYK